jgi:hypothetical protein
VGAAVLVEGEDPKLLLWAPFLRLVWRPLQLLAVFRSVRTWTHGGSERWRTMERYNTVEMPAPRPEVQPPTAAGCAGAEATRV